ncbi:TetR/AcrR family transcriptional regulator [Amycolatopsis sp.]|uniref:TetR/AcrR family transcriptional regulator n=1 Tax=Amycolatopsis sp. TaxID=37632 RepID=UPI002CA4A00C|nr:TetR/AcrR family transcriptional regulator [Amycolatopsis sp.]HVV13225.1 TetR/AcrR family transcriptional regulator [Amycolatopsis sp.]
MKRSEKAAETEAALKAAARRVFAERGYLNTKITDITAEAGRAAGSFYNHFAGKEELLEALLADMSAESDSAASEAEHKSDFTDPDAIRFHVAAYWRFYRKHAATLRALEEAALVSETFAKTFAKFGETEMADVLGHIRYITDAGMTLPTTPRSSLNLMYGMVDSYVRHWHKVGAELTDDEAIEALTRFVYRGLTGRDY